MIANRHSGFAAALARCWVFAAVILVAISSRQAWGCYVHSGQYQGLQANHALTIPVSVATREAIVSGELRDIPRRDSTQRLLALQQLTTIVGLFARKSSNAEATAAPDFALLLTESGLWTGFSAVGDNAWQVRQHLSGPRENDIILIVSDPAMAALLQGRMSVDQAVQQGVLAASDASPSSQRSLAAFSHFVDGFAQSGFARFRLDKNLPNIRFSNPLSSIVKTGSKPINR